MVRRIPNIFFKKCLRNEKTHKNLREKNPNAHIRIFENSQTNKKCLTN
jgi:hypothetical protein